MEENVFKILKSISKLTDPTLHRYHSNITSQQNLRQMHLGRAGVMNYNFSMQFMKEHL